METTDHRLIVLAEADNVAVARCAIAAGVELAIHGQPVTLTQAFALGHKIATRPISPGDKVLKYGVPIGSATQPVAIGEHVHIHNMKSDYTPTYALNQDGTVA